MAMTFSKRGLSMHQFPCTISIFCSPMLAVMVHFREPIFGHNVALTFSCNMTLMLLFREFRGGQYGSKTAIFFY
jgi:hypothetical protein